MFKIDNLWKNLIFDGTSRLKLEMTSQVIFIHNNITV